VFLTARFLAAVAQAPHNFVDLPLLSVLLNFPALQLIAN
jgi:hypothetical protein